MRKGKARVTLWLMALLIAATPMVQPAAGERPHHERPRLVVGIMVDQMRYDYLYRFWDQYGERGFRRLLNEGFSFDNAHFDYAPTFTGPGHASIYTGATPATHGIISNLWYDRTSGRNVYVVADQAATPVGTEADAGRMSPHRLLASTLSDELILHTNHRSKAVSFSLKDRGAILPAGHLGDAYWFDADSGQVVSSGHYMEALPDWVVAFNARDLTGRYLEEPWDTLLPMEHYTASIEDDNPYEFRLSRTFPHDVPAMAAHQGREVLQYVPRGNTYTLDFARAAIVGEGLGQDEFTDLLAISLSSTDYIGHAWGPASVEVQDTYLRLDRELGDFLDHLDEMIGLEDVVIFLASDHGVAHNPNYLQDLGHPAGYFSGSAIEERLANHLEAIYGENLVVTFSNLQVYLDHDRLRELNLAPAEVESRIIDYLLREEEGVAGAIGAGSLNNAEFTEGVRSRIQRGFHPQRSGDVAVWFKPQWLPEFREGTGSTHHSPYNYDSRSPMVFFGWDIPAGRSALPVSVTDIAPTLAVFMQTPFPNAATGRPLQDVIYRRGR